MKDIKRFKKYAGHRQEHEGHRTTFDRGTSVLRRAAPKEQQMHGVTCNPIHGVTFSLEKRV